MTAAIVQLFVHPAPGPFARRKIAALLRAFEAAGSTVLVTPSTSERMAIDPRAEHVCVAGGDGTLRHVVAALHRLDRDIPVSVYPAGTVNLFARELGYPTAAATFVRRVLGPASPSIHHTGLVGGIPVLTCASIGPDAYAVDRLDPALKAWIGRMAYLVAFVRLLLHWPRPRLTLAWDGNMLECEAVYIAKGRYFAGPWSFAPDARSTDALLHVVALQRARRRDFIRFAWALLRHEPVASLPGVQTFQCATLAIDGNASVPLQADGDVVARLPASIALDPAPTSFA